MKNIENISKIRWLHSIELEPGLITPGIVPLQHLNQMVNYLSLPEDMTGITVLDVGARDGFFSFEAERRGAEVIAVDIQAVNEVGFGLAKEFLNSKAKFIQSNVYDLTLEKIGGKPVDMVFFLGLMYHLRHPLLAIDTLWNLLKPNGTMYLETAYLDEYFVLSDNNFTSLDNIHPILAKTALLQYYRNDELNPGDFSNWFSPNRLALEEILASAGFKSNLLSNWGNRILYKAIKLDELPEYKLSEHGIEPQMGRWSRLSPNDLDARRKNRHFESLDDHQKAKFVLEDLQKSRLYKLLRFLGFWTLLSKQIETALADKQPSQ